MDTNQALISSAISIGTYIVYKLAQRYYFRSGCHDNTLEISVVDKEAVEMTQVTTQEKPEERKSVTL